MMADCQDSPVALVTGSAAPRLGNHIARYLAQRGYRIAIHGLHSRESGEQTVSELRAAGAQAMLHLADLRDERQVAKLTESVQQKFGRIDALVHTAGVWEPRRLEETTAEDVRRQFEINTLATFLCCKSVGLVMAAQPEGGAIVTFGDWALERPYPRYAAYFTSKGAIPTLTRALAVELAQRNPRVRVNAILPGRGMLPDQLNEQEREAIRQGTLTRRDADPQDIAHAAQFLIENPMVTGVSLPIDGGRSIGEG